jgi:hypothetical protein
MKRLALLTAASVWAVVVGACTDQARVFPLDPTAMTAGIPKIEFVRQGLGRGPVTVTMPDGEILKGEYQVTENAAIGVGFSGAQTYSAIGFGSGRGVVLSATGEHTIINCDGTADIGGHGSGTCQTSQGNKYRIMF